MAIVLDDFFWIVIFPTSLLAVAAIYYLYGVRKKRVETALRQFAKETGLDYDHHLLRYSFVRGQYKGYDVEAGVYSDYDAAWGGAGMWYTGLLNAVVLGIRNFTAIKLSHDKQLDEKYSEGSLHYGKDHLVLTYPMVVDDPKLLEMGLKELVEKAEEL